MTDINAARQAVIDQLSLAEDALKRADFTAAETALKAVIAAANASNQKDVKSKAFGALNSARAAARRAAAKAAVLPNPFTGAPTL